jgi:hypothetical protein
MKLKWKVAEAPTGPYRSFHKRAWPAASYPNGKPAAWLNCEDDYRPRDVREGRHKPITITLAHHQHPEAGNSWKVMRLKGQAATLQEAKDHVQAFLEIHGEFWPKELTSVRPI